MLIIRARKAKRERLQSRCVWLGHAMQELVVLLFLFQVKSIRVRSNDETDYMILLEDSRVAKRENLRYLPG
jgi:hypothetical protein